MRLQLVGRDTEVEALRGCLRAGDAGRPQLVLCRGEPGIGKTRLADELAALAAASGAVSVWGLTAESVGAPPSWPWRQVFRALADEVDVAGLARMRGVDGDLARLVPEVFEGTERIVDGAATADDRFRQFEAAGRVLREVARQRLVVVILEDLHWADAETLLLLRHVARTMTDERLVVFASSRNAGQRHPELFGVLAREPVTTVVELAGLPEAAVRDQLSELIASDVDDATVADVHGLTGGNPLFVGEVGRAIADARKGRRFTPLTATVRDAIAERLAPLSSACATVLATAALVGRQFSVPVVSAATDVDALAALELLGEAIAEGLVEAVSSPHEFRFVHDLVRDAIEARLALADAVRAHRRIAEAIEQLCGPALGAHIFDVARHWAAAALDGDAAAAAAWIWRAGDAAMQQLAYEEAARLFRQAVDIGAAAVSVEDRSRLLIAAGRALQLSGEQAARTDACVEAARLAAEVGRPDLAAAAALVLEPAGNPRFDLTTRRVCEQALVALDPAETALRARLMARRIETFGFLHHDEAVSSASVEALRLAEASGDDIALAAALRARHVVCVAPEGLSERRALASRMLALGREAGDAHVQMSAHLWAIDVALEQGDLVGVSASIDALALCAREVRGPFARFEVTRCRAVLAQAQGRFADALRLEAEAFATLAPTDHDVRFTFRSALLMNVGYHTGFDDDALAAFEYSGAPEGHTDMLGFIGRLANAYGLATAGRLPAAANLYRALGPVGGWDPPPHVVLCGYAFGLGAAGALGESADVAVLYDRLAPYRGHHVASGMSAMVYFGPVELRLGIGGRQLGRLDDAVFDLETALATTAANGAAGFHAEAQYELAATLQERGAPGDVDRGRALFDAAAKSAAALGMRPRPDRIGGGNGAAPLTRREREVALLVSEGLTNREIAERLFISERTAESHVQHILTKLGQSTRSQIAAWAVTQQISTETR